MDLTDLMKGLNQALTAAIIIALSKNPNPTKGNALWKNTKRNKLERENKHLQESSLVCTNY